jgi:hypothetical protein
MQCPPCGTGRDAHARGPPAKGLSPILFPGTFDKVRSHPTYPLVESDP